MASGFSHRMCFPASAAAMAISSDRYIGIDTLRQFIEVDRIEVLNKNETSGDYYKNLEDFERTYFKSLLEKNKWDIELSAKEAGVNIATIYRKIKKLNLQR